MRQEKPKLIRKLNKENKSINGLNQLKATRLTKVYKMPDLRKICSANKIKYYNTLKIDEMLEQLAKIEVIIIPEDVV